MIALIVFAAKYLIVLPVIVAFGYLFITNRKRDYLTYAVIVLIVSYAFGFVAGQLYNNPLPFVVENVAPLIAHAANNGFPSDHVLLAGALAGIVSAFNLPLGIFLWLIAVLIGIGRVLALVHHPIDIVTSLLISALSALLVWRLRYFYQPIQPTSINSGA